MEDPHYLRFARAIALAGAVSAAGGCCPLVPDSIACSHCACAWDTTSTSRPVACDTIHREPQCCPAPVSMPVVGPLSPPDLAS